MDSNEFYNQLQPYLYDNTRQFIRELISFASSPYDMQTYDSRVVYDFQPTMQSIATSTGMNYFISFSVHFNSLREACPSVGASYKQGS